MYGKAQAPVLGPFGTLRLRHNCLKLVRIALSDLHGPFQSTFFTNQEEQTHSRMQLRKEVQLCIIKTSHQKEQSVKWQQYQETKQ